MGKLKWLETNCPKCQSQMSSWDVRASKALGYKKFQVCESCLCKEYDIASPAHLRASLESYLGIRPCIGI